ncbi:hypothetical protein F1880_009705, partial [Penicillium rolfsii]
EPHVVELGDLELGDLELGDQSSVTLNSVSIQLGSLLLYHYYHKLSSSLLGAATKMAQSIGSQRQYLLEKIGDIEQRTGAWYQRKDSSLQMPLDLMEPEDAPPK